MSKAMRCRMKIGLSSTPGSHSMGSMPSTSPCAVLLRIVFILGSQFHFGYCGPKFSPATVGSRFPLLDHAFPMAKMEGVLQRAIAVPPDCALTWSLS